MGLASKVMHFHSTDYRLHAAPQEGTCGLGTPLGRLTFPVTFRATFGGGTVAGVIYATNAGNIDMNPVLVITGPAPAKSSDSYPRGRAMRRLVEPFQSGDDPTLDEISSTHQGARDWEPLDSLQHLARQGTAPG
jgi:hypothetical protein